MGKVCELFYELFNVNILGKIADLYKI